MQQSMPRQMPVYQQSPMQPRTNKLFVSSLEEAMNRQVDFNTVLVYFDTNRDLLYSIYTNEWGQKFSEVFEIARYVDKSGQQEQADLSDLLKRVAALEEVTRRLDNGKLNESSTPEPASTV
jgi:hypothetical protein